MSNVKQRAEETYQEAAEAAVLNGLRLTNPAAGHYVLAQYPTGYVINLYPKGRGEGGGIRHDTQRPGPLLPIPRQWTLLDVVMAAIRQQNGEPAADGCRTPDRGRHVRG